MLFKMPNKNFQWRARPNCNINSERKCCADISDWQTLVSKAENCVENNLHALVLKYKIVLEVWQ